MRKRRKIRRGIKKLFLLLFLCLFVVFYIMFFTDNKQINKPNYVPSGDNANNQIDETTKPNIEEPKTFLNDIKNAEKLNEEQIKLLTDFFDTYYKSKKELKEYDMTKFFVSGSEDALINQTAVSLLINIRKLNKNDLTLKSAKYDLNIDSVEQKSNSIKIMVLENNYLRFNFMSDIESKVYNVKNEFEIKKVGDEYKIVSYKKVKDFYVMITDKYKGGGATELNNIKEEYLKVIRSNNIKNQKNYDDYLNNIGKPTKTCDNTYDRDKAYNYAISWVNKRNPEWSSFGSNCQNFASQVVNAGGVIMDYKGSAKNHLQWKFYGNNYNENEVASGYVYTWTYVPYFYTYAKNNTGTGICASVDINPYYAEAGDVIHVGATAPTRHALVVIGTYKKDGKVVDVLVNSNTIDLENYPMSAYVYPHTSVIKIHGWNN